MSADFVLDDATTWQYYIEHREEDGACYSTAGKPKGSTLYDAISRQVIGDATKAQHIRNTVLRHAFRVRANSQHPLYEGYMSREQSFYERAEWELFAALDSPDLSWDFEEIAWVIGYALNISLRIYGSISPEGKVGDHICSAGPEHGQQCLVL